MGVEIEASPDVSVFLRALFTPKVLQKRMLQGEGAFCGIAEAVSAAELLDVRST